MLEHDAIEKLESLFPAKNRLQKPIGFLPGGEAFYPSWGSDDPTRQARNELQLQLDGGCHRDLPSGKLT